MDKIAEAFALFDAYNQQDPKKIKREGIEYPSEYFYALQLHDWVINLQPAASEALLLASRCQHIGRWKISRDKYPAGKAGYFKWRTDLAKFHADTASALLREAGYDDREINSVRHIMLKENLRTDPDVQTMENALCLVFLQFQYEDFLAKHDDQKVIRIIQRSWLKMSDPGRAAALKLSFKDKARVLLDEALSK